MGYVCVALGSIGRYEGCALLGGIKLMKKQEQPGSQST
jgi:hypothetical protein